MTIEEFKKLKVGDKVKIIDKPISITKGWTNNMNQWLGKTMTIQNINFESCKPFASMKEDHSFWSWFPHMIEYRIEEYPTIISHLIRGNKTIVTLSNGKVGVAKCSPEDKFDVYEGLRVATARAYGKELFETEEIKEVKCIAREGEYVKLINPDSVSIAYGLTMNQIIQIKGVDAEVSWVTTNKNKDVYLYPYEYVVLENYKPKK